MELDSRKDTDGGPPSTVRTASICRARRADSYPLSVPRVASALTALGYLAFVAVHIFKSLYYANEQGFEDWPTDRLGALAIAFGIGALIATAGAVKARVSPCRAWTCLVVAMASSYVAAYAVDISARTQVNDTLILAGMWTAVAVALATTASASLLPRVQ